jgi:hypothetical protein
MLPAERQFSSQRKGVKQKGSGLVFCHKSGREVIFLDQGDLMIQSNRDAWQADRRGFSLGGRVSCQLLTGADALKPASP